MKVEVHLYGAFRDYEPNARIIVEVDNDACVGDLRSAVLAYADAHWLGFKPGLLAYSAFASEASILRDGESLPSSGAMAVLPPVSGG
jgi:molybdopterin synthase sulfur carrier subunit